MEPLEKKAKEESELEKFDALFPILVSDLADFGIKDTSILQASDWFRQVNEYNVPFGKKSRGLTIVHSYKYIKGNNATEEDLHLARILGWCIEWLQAFFLVADDIMDASEVRRGNPCWYKKPNVGLVAINDSFYLEGAIYAILRKYFKGKSYYVDLMDLFHEITLNTIYGQNLDLLSGPSDKVDFTNFTAERYSAIVKWKTAYYSFYLPVACAMYMCEIFDEDLHNNVKSILLKLGEYFQIQDDYLDCYGKHEVIGKIGRDIEENKCSWLVVQALQRATPEQLTELKENYAHEDPQKVNKVKAIYNTMNLQDLYHQFEEQSYQDIMLLIEKHSLSLPKQLFVDMTRKIYKRQK